MEDDIVGGHSTGVAPITLSSSSLVSSTDNVQLTNSLGGPPQYTDMTDATEESLLASGEFDSSTCEVPVADIGRQHSGANRAPSLFWHMISRLFGYVTLGLRGIISHTPSVSRQDEARRRIIHGEFVRPIRLNITLKNGQSVQVHLVAWFDYFSPCNIANRGLLDRYPTLRLDSAEREYFARTLGGPACSIGRFTARWWGEGIEFFNDRFQDHQFEISDIPDGDLGFDVIIGRPAIMQQGLFNPSFEDCNRLAAPMNSYRPTPDLDPRTTHAAEQRATQTQQSEALEMQQFTTHEVERRQYAELRAIAYLKNRYRQEYEREYQAAEAEYNTLYPQP